MDLEFVEVDNGSDVNIEAHEEIEMKIDDETKEDEEEYEFPLFGASSIKEDKREEVNDEEMEFPLFGGDRGRSQTKIMKVSLREASEERINNERPAEYYFASYSDLQKGQFEMAAVSFEQIWSESIIKNKDSHPHRVMNLAEYNAKIDKTRAIEKDKKAKMRRRPGKKARLNKISCKERKVDREKIQKKLEQEKLAKLKKKMFHKRGGKKNKKKDTKPAPTKPKYKTE